MLLSKQNVQPRVLLVEDSEETLELSRLTLESQACEVVGVSSAESALGLLNAGERFDLVFTDVCLGGISGIEIANRVRAAFARLPILVTSGMSRHDVLPQLHHGIHFLPKPYSMSELLEAVRHCFIHASDDQPQGATQAA